MRRLYRYRHPILALILFVGLYALAGFIIAPYLLKRYGVPAVSQAIQRPVILQEVRINPFTLSVRVMDFEIQEPNQSSLIGFDELFIDFEAVSLFRRAYTFKEISLKLPYLSARISPDKKLNLLGLIPPRTEPPPDQPEKRTLPPIRIDLVHIESGILEFRDESKKKPVTIDMVPIEMQLRNFSTKPGHESAHAFTAEFGQGETVSWNGTFSLEPLESEGTVSLSNIDLVTFWQSIQDRFKFDFRSGALDLDIRYRFDIRADPFNFHIDDGKMGLRNLELAEKGGKNPLIVVPTVKINDLGLDYAGRALTIGTITTGQGRIRGWRGPDGTVNYVPLLAVVDMEDREAVRSSPPQASEPARSAPWSITVKTVQVDKYGIEFEDRSVAPAAQLAIDDLRATAKAIRLPFAKPINVAIELTLNKTGQVKAEGLVGLNPLRADVGLQLSQVALRPFQPYVNRFVHGDIDSGDLHMEGKARYAAQSADEPLMTYDGNVSIHDFELTDPATQKAILSWGSLAFADMAVEVDPTAVKIKGIEWRKPSIHAVADTGGTLNLSRLLVGAGNAVDRAVTKTAATVPPPRKKDRTIPISVETVKLVNMETTFIDQSVEPPVMTGIENLSGTIKGLSSQEVARAKVSLTGKVDNVAPMKIVGQINPLSDNQYTDLKISFDNLDLTAASPYAGKYVGFPITKGKLFLDLMYRVSKKQLHGENNVVVDQLTFGDKTNSPDATSLPVRLAVALLKDRSGKIQIDLPVRGNLNEPDFRYGRVLLNALINLVSKVATSPFAAIGNLIGGKGEDLQYIAFEPGSASLSDQGRRKMQMLAQALQERPALRLDILGRADPQVDGQAIARHKVEAAIVARYGQGRKKSASSVPPPDRRLELLNELYIQQFGRQPLKREEVAGGKTVERVMSAVEVTAELVAKQSVMEVELRQLAQSRAGSIRDFFVGGGGGGPEIQDQEQAFERKPGEQRESEEALHNPSGKEAGSNSGSLLDEDRVFVLEVELGGAEGGQVRSQLQLSGA